MSKLSAQSVQLSGFVVAMALAASGIGQVALATGTGGGHRAPADRAFVELVGPGIAVADLAAGDTAEGTTDLVNRTGRPLEVAQVSVLNDAPSLLTLDTVNGLRITVDRCDQPWTASGAAAVSCPSHSAAVIDSEPVDRLTARPITAMRLPRGGRVHIRIRVALPATAGNDLMGQAATVRVAFTLVEE